METLKQQKAKYDLIPELQAHLKKHNTLWMKFVHPKMMCFIGHESLALSNGCQILLRNLTNGEEKILNTSSEGLGDGVNAISGHKTHNFFAYAEKRDNPRIFLLNYPDFKNVLTLTCPFYEMVKISFSDTELMFGISGYPECSIIVWKWRTGERMALMKTSMTFNHNISVKTSYSFSPIYLGQLQTDSINLLMWEVQLCGKKCIMRSRSVTLDCEDPRLEITDFLWSHDSNCYSLDNTGNVYKLDFEGYVMRAIIKSDGGIRHTSFCWYMNGLLVQNANNKISHYDSKDNWSISWSIENHNDIVKMHSLPTRDNVIVLTQQNDLCYFDEKTRTFQLLRGEEAGITHFVLIPPQNEVFVSLSKSVNMSLWEVKTGDLIQSVIFDVNALCLRCNGFYPYVGVCFENGLLKLFSCLKRTLEPMAEFQLTRTPLHEIKFFEHFKMLTVANMSVGQIFVIEGVPGGKFKVISAITHNAQIVDYVLVGAKSCLRLFIIPVTSDRNIIGNIIVRYCIIQHKEPTVKTYELEDPERRYKSLHVSNNHPHLHRDRYLFAIPFDNKNFHELEVKRGDTHARIINRRRSFHMMRMISYNFDANYILSYAYDGIVIIRSPTWEIKYVLQPHHHFEGGVLKCAYDPHNNRTLTLGRDGVLICNEFAGTPITTRQQAILLTQAEELADLFKTPTIGFMPKGIYEGLCWLEYKAMLKVESERIKYEKRRRKIVDEFDAIKEATNILLSHNMDGPKIERLDLQEFNLNLAHKEELVRKSKEDCENLKNYLERLVQEQDRVFRVIKERFWDPVDQPVKNLWGIFGNFDVQSYAVLPLDMKLGERLEQIEIYRSIEDICAKDDIFKPWENKTNAEREDLLARTPKLSNEQAAVYNYLDEDETSEMSMQERHDEYESYVAYFGSTLPWYIKVHEPALHYEQAEVLTFLQQDWTYSISLNHQEKLREYFNKEFDVIVQYKMREMGTIIERNARLRYIISELTYFTGEELDVELVDPTWKQDEDPDLIRKVGNAEVGIMPYISPSEQALLNAKAAEEERIRLLLMADDFKERALMKMMNGVLEVRWEDELRREITKPKCMNEKNPEDFNEEDLRQIRDYEEAFTFLKSERERYKTILYAEYTKLGNMLRDGVRKFNDKLHELLVKKIQVQACFSAELLRMHRLRARGAWRKEADICEKNAEREIALNEEKTSQYNTLVSSLTNYDTDLKSALEIVINKERLIDKTFKREFQDYSAPQYELLTKLYKKRPKSTWKSIMSPSLLMEMAKVIATSKPSVLIFGDAVEYIKAFDFMDKYVGIPPIIDEGLFHNMCRIRRLKIEMELKIRACQLEITEGENTLQFYQLYHSKHKELGQELLSQLEEIREKKVKSMLNIEMQVTIKQAYVELPRTGQQKDFEDAILINRKDVETINAIICQAGEKKIKAMRNALQFRKEIMIKEFQHQEKKMEISDLEHQYVDINSIKLTKEIQQFLKTRSRGDTEKLVSFEHEVESLRERYRRQIEQRQHEVLDLHNKLDLLHAENKRLNNEITYVNIDVNEANVKVDSSLTEKERKFVNLRIKANLKRSQMVQQIQANHNEIMVLQAELELCRLRTVPILDYKIVD